VDLFLQPPFLPHLTPLSKDTFFFQNCDILIKLSNSGIPPVKYKRILQICLISGEVDEVCVLGYYAAYSDNSLPKFRGNLLVRSSGLKNLSES